MLWKGRRGSSNVEDRRGRSAKGLVGGGIGTIVIALAIYFLGGDPTTVLNNALLNTDQSGGIPTQPVMDACSAASIPCMSIQAEMEREISELSPEEQAEFLRDIGVDAGARDRFIQAAYSLLDLISFLTVGEDECRAWPVQRNSDAVTAAGKIHTDLARGFIRAEVISYEEFMAAGDMNRAKKAGKLRLEGKNYIVQDGDILNIRFSV